MPETIQEVVDACTPAIEEILNRHKAVLGPGREFVVTIGIRETETVAVTVAERTKSKLTKDDWRRILSRKWVGKYRLVLEAIRDNKNQPTSVDDIQLKSPDFYYNDRDRLNRVFKRAKLPFFVRNTGHGSRNAMLQVVRN